MQPLEGSLMSVRLAAGAVPVEEPRTGTLLINGCAGAVASRKPCPELCPGTGASCGAHPWRPDLLVGPPLTRDR